MNNGFMQKYILKIEVKLIKAEKLRTKENFSPGVIDAFPNILPRQEIKNGTR